MVTFRSFSLSVWSLSGIGGVTAGPSNALVVSLQPVVLGPLHQAAQEVAQFVTQQKGGRDTAACAALVVTT